MSIVAVAQMVSSSRVEDNLSKAEKIIKTAKDRNASLILLPENFALMGLKESDKINYAEHYLSGPIQKFISDSAKKYSTWIISGTVPLKAEVDKVRAASLVFDNKGKCVARYDKIHLFDVRVSEHEAHEESLTVERGEQLVVVDTPVGKIGLSVCYDLRFPELYLELRMKGAEIFSIPSAFTAVTGQAHWEVLLRSRAIENLSYVLAANQGGRHENKRQTHGHSMIIEPWGRVLAEQESGEGVICAEIDLNRLHHLRRQFPCNDHHVLNPINYNIEKA